MTRTLVAGVDTSTQSCKVRVTDAETGEMSTKLSLKQIPSPGAV